MHVDVLGALRHGSGPVPPSRLRDFASRARDARTSGGVPPSRSRVPTSRARGPASRSRAPTSRPRAPSPRHPDTPPRRRVPLSRPRDAGSPLRLRSSRPRGPTSRPRGPASRPRGPTSRPRGPVSRYRLPTSRPRGPTSIRGEGPLSTSGIERPNTRWNIPRWWPSIHDDRSWHQEIQPIFVVDRTYVPVVTIRSPNTKEARWHVSKGPRTQGPW